MTTTAPTWKACCGASRMLPPLRRPGGMRWPSCADTTAAVSPTDERLALYRAVRDSGWLTDDEGFYLVSAQVEDVADAEAETQLRDLDRRLAELEERFVSQDADRADAQTEPNSGALHEHDEASRQYQEAWDAIFLGKLASAGEPAIAALFASDREEFALRYDCGLRSLNALAAEDDASPDDLLSVASYLDPSRAELARQALTEAGIPCSTGDTTYLFGNATGGVTVDVRRGDARRAHNVLTAAHDGRAEKRPSWTCPTCGQQIPGEWQACWQCAASPAGAAEAGAPEDDAVEFGAAEVGAEGEIAAAPQVDAEAASMPAFSFHKVLGAAAIVIFVLIPLATGHIVPALCIAPFVFLVVFILTRFDPPTDPPAKSPPHTAESPDAAGAKDADNAIILDNFSFPQTAIRNATVRRAWQASVIACLAFPPLRFYSFGLLWNLAGRRLPLHPADRWRTRAAYVLSILSIIFSLFFFPRYRPDCLDVFPKPLRRRHAALAAPSI